MRAQLFFTALDQSRLRVFRTVDSLERLASNFAAGNRQCAGGTCPRPTIVVGRGRRAKTRGFPTSGRADARPALFHCAGPESAACFPDRRFSRTSCFEFRRRKPSMCRWNLSAPDDCSWEGSQGENTRLSYVGPRRCAPSSFSLRWTRVGCVFSGPSILSNVLLRISPPETVNVQV